MTKVIIATYYNSLAKRKNASSAPHQSLIPRDFFTLCHLKILSWQHNISGRPTVPREATGLLNN